MSADRKSPLESASGFAGESHSGASLFSGEGNGAGGAELDTERLRVISEEISRELAPQLEHTALVLYDRDPQHLQAQWYVTPEELAQARSLFPGGGKGVHQVLRLCRLDQDSKPQIVASVPQELGQGIDEGQNGFDLNGDSAEYECELGLESEEGGWVLLARSNRIRTASPNLPPPPVVPVPPRPPITRALNERVKIFQQLEDIVIEAALAADGEPLYPVFPDLELDDTPAVRRAAPAEAELGQAHELDEKVVFPSVASEQPVPDELAESWTVPGAVLPEMPPPLLPSSPEPGAFSGDMPGPVYDPRAALSSAALRCVRLPESELEVEAELIVQGHTRPGSTVDLFGRPVPVGDDGHFYVRRPIDDPLLLSQLISGRPFEFPEDTKAE